MGNLKVARELLEQSGEGDKDTTEKLMDLSSAKTALLLDIAESLQTLVVQNAVGCDGDLRRRVQVLEQGESELGLDEERARA